jgi:ectoine hydroxylase-related dioxygenase (phytanoyl-CoA dioxygenase family)
MTQTMTELTAQAAADVEGTFRLLAQHRQVNSIIRPSSVECSCGEALPLPSGNIDWPEAEHMALVRHHSEVLAAAKLALAETPDQVHFSEHLRTGTNRAPEGWTNQRWHQDATLDAGTSHVRVGPAYVIQCQWCPETFIGTRMADAMRLFRVHEAAAQGGRGL